MKQTKIAATRAATFVKFHLLDKSHTHAHRCFFGLIVGMAGVVVSDIMAHMYMLSLVGHWFGYLLHGAGCLPFLNLIDPEPTNEL